MEDERVIAALREFTNLPEDISDDEMLRGSEGSYLLARLRLSVATDDFMAELRETALFKAIDRLF